MLDDYGRTAKERKDWLHRNHDFWSKRLDWLSGRIRTLEITLNNLNTEQKHGIAVIDEINAELGE